MNNSVPVLCRVAYLQAVPVSSTASVQPPTLRSQPSATIAQLTKQAAQQPISQPSVQLIGNIVTSGNSMAAAVGKSLASIQAGNPLGNSVGNSMTSQHTSVTSMLVTQADPKPKLSVVMEAAQRGGRQP